MRRRYRSGEPIKTMRIAGVKYEIHVNSDGEFTCSAAGDYLKFDTLKALIASLRKSARKRSITVSIPAMLMNVNKYAKNKASSSFYHQTYIGQTCEPITLVGVDTDSMEVKYRDPDGKLQGRSGGLRDHTSIVKPMKPEEVSTWERLYAAKTKAKDELRAFEERFEWREVYGAVKDAISAKADDPNETPEEESEGDPRVGSVRKK